MVLIEDRTQNGYTAESVDLEISSEENGMTSEQECFWNEVKIIQDLVVNVTLLRISKYDDAEKLLNDVTYETIYGIMELLDGHKNSDLKCEVINKITGCSINADIEPHNYSEDFLKCSDV